MEGAEAFRRAGSRHRPFSFLSRFTLSSSHGPAPFSTTRAASLLLDVFDDLLHRLPFLAERGPTWTQLSCGNLVSPSH